MQTSGAMRRENANVYSSSFRGAVAAKRNPSLREAGGEMDIASLQAPSRNDEGERAREAAVPKGEATGRHHLPGHGTRPRAP